MLQKRMTGIETIIGKIDTRIRLSGQFRIGVRCFGVDRGVGKNDDLEEEGH